MSKKSLSFLTSYFFIIPANRCAILENDVDEEKVGLKVEDGEEKKEEDNDNMEVSDEDVDGSNDNEEEDRTNKYKE